MKKNSVLLYIVCGIWAAGCSEIEPIELIEPEREIDTETLKQSKSNLEEKQVAVGAIYEWGQSERSNLMHVPDEMDMIIVKDGFMELSAYQRSDLNDVKERKATRVLINIDLNTPFHQFWTSISPQLKLFEKERREIEQKQFDAQLEDKVSAYDAQLREEHPGWGEWYTSYQVSLYRTNLINTFESELKEILAMEMDSLSSILLKTELEDNNLGIPAWETIRSVIDNERFDGICVEMPDDIDYDSVFVADFCAKISNDAGKEKKYLLIVENPIVEMSDIANNAQWIIHRLKNKDEALLAAFDDTSKRWPHLRFLPSVDFSRNDLDKGFKDKEAFSSSGAYPMPIEVGKWRVGNKGGVVFYHIEKNYNDINGSVTYNMLRQAIHVLRN